MVLISLSESSAAGKSTRYPMEKFSSSSGKLYLYPQENYPYSNNYFLLCLWFCSINVRRKVFTVSVNTHCETRFILRGAFQLKKRCCRGIITGSYTQ